MDTLTSLRVFCRVAELRNFTAAAERLRLSPAMASKHVMHLEQRLATRLLNRTSRSVSLTEAGALYLERARHALDALDEAEAAIGSTVVNPRGTLRLSAPIWAASQPFVALLADYRTRYPEVRIDIDLSGRMVNLVEEGFDVALRASASLDPGLIARKLATVPFLLVASPAYLDRTGRPAQLFELQGRALLAYSPILTDGSIPLAMPGGAERIVFDPVLESTNETMLHLAARDAMGIALLPEWLIREDLATGALETVLPGHLVPAPLYAVYPSRKFLSAKVRTFLDMCAADGRLGTI